MTTVEVTAVQNALIAARAAGVERVVFLDAAEHRWVEGVRMVERKFRTVLESSGVQPIEAEGTMFDPAMHEAIRRMLGPTHEIIYASGIDQALSQLESQLTENAMVKTVRGGGVTVW